VATNRRWTICRRVWFLQLVALLAIEVGGLWRHGFTLQVAVALPNILTGIGVGMWAAGKTPQFILSLASCAAALMLAEIAVRVARPLPESQMEKIKNIFRFDKRLGWRLEPGARATFTTEEGKQIPITINSAGFRDREYGDGSANETSERIAVLGDSFVANIAVEQSKVFTARLHEDLRPLFEVRNYGVAGYGQVQEFLLLDEVLEKHHPALVLEVVYARNDFGDNLGSFGVTGIKRPECRITPDGAIEAITEVRESDLYHSDAGWLYTWISGMGLHRLLRQGLYRLVPSQMPQDQIAAEVYLCRRDWRASERHAFEVIKSLLTAMAHKSEEHQARFGIVVAPSRWQVEDEEWSRLLHDSKLDESQYDRTLPNRMILDFCQKAGYQCLDLLPALTSRAKQGEHLYFRTDEHWNALGQVRVAETILEWLQKNMLRPE